MPRFRERNGRRCLSKSFSRIFRKSRRRSRLRYATTAGATRITRSSGQFSVPREEENQAEILPRLLKKIWEDLRNSKKTSMPPQQIDLVPAGHGLSLMEGY